MPLALKVSAAIAVAMLVGTASSPRIQAQSRERLAFEVASVKENKSTNTEDVKVEFLPGGRFVAKNLPLAIIISIADGLPLVSDRLTGGPVWIGKTRYDIEAVPQKDAIASGDAVNSRNQRIRLMLQALLADRFGLRIHREIKEGPVYEISTKNGPPRLVKSKLTEEDCFSSPTSPAPGDPAACHTFAGGAVQGLRARAANISDLASWMLNWTDHPVVDKTGIEGLFDIETEGWTPLNAKAPPPGQDRPPGDDRPTIFQIFDRLGLKLELKKGQFEAFVIDQVEKPAPN